MKGRLKRLDANHPDTHGDGGMSRWRAGVEAEINSTMGSSYDWDTDVSGSLQGAGGVGGLLFLTKAAESMTSPVAPKGRPKLAHQQIKPEPLKVQV